MTGGLGCLSLLSLGVVLTLRQSATYGAEPWRRTLLLCEAIAGHMGPRASAQGGDIPLSLAAVLQDDLAFRHALLEAELVAWLQATEDPGVDVLAPLLSAGIHGAKA